MCFCLCVCLSVRAITFESLYIETSLFGMQVHLDHIYVKLQVINEVKVTHKGEGHIKVKVKISTSFPILCQILLISTYCFFVCGYKSLIRSRSYIKVKVKYLHRFKFYVAHTFCKRVVCIQVKCDLVFCAFYSSF